MAIAAWQDMSTSSLRLRPTFQLVAMRSAWLQFVLQVCDEPRHLILRRGDKMNKLSNTAIPEPKPDTAIKPTEATKDSWIKTTALRLPPREMKVETR